MTFSFNWQGPPTDYPGAALGHSAQGADALQDVVANALKEAAVDVLAVLDARAVSVNGYGSAMGTAEGAVVSLNISVPQAAEGDTIQSRLAAQRPVDLGGQPGDTGPLPDSASEAGVSSSHPDTTAEDDAPQGD